MTENKTTMNTAARQAYEPVQVKVTKVTPQGILCQSGTSGREVAPTLTPYERF